MVDLDLTMPNTEKLALTLEDKEKYVVHYKNLQFYLSQGMWLTKVHRVIEFDQEPWMERYISMNTEFHKQEKSDFETDFYKVMNNLVFGKTMENLRNRTDVKIVRDWETDKIRNLVSSPSFDRFTIFGNDMTGIHMHKPELLLNKPVYTGMTILENSKILMYEFFYNHLKAIYGPKCELIYTDTDSLLLNIQTEDVYKDMKEDSWLYDTSNYPKRPPTLRCQKQKGFGQDERRVRRRDDRGSRSRKAEDVLGEESRQKKYKEGEGGEKNVIEKEITHEHYKEALFGSKQFMN